MGATIADLRGIAEAKSGIDGWQVYRITWTDSGDFIVRGCVPSGVYKRGPRKGQPKFRPAMPDTERVVIVTKAELTP